MKTVSLLLVRWLVIFLSLLASNLWAQPVGTGMLEGRVSNATLGTYLGNARLTLGPLQTFSDEFGFYRFTTAPAGEARVRVSYTGLPSLERIVVITAGQRMTQDFAFGSAIGAQAEGAVQLDAFVVAASREMSATALAINEQRFTRNIKTVVATDTFGDIADGNVGEFVKFLPGINVGFTAGEGSSISIGGMPPEATPVTIDGNRIASAGGETRAIQLNQVSINNMSRVDVVRSPNPDSPANAIGGSVNLIPKSAFERRAPTYTAKAFTAFRDYALQGKPYKFYSNFEVGAVVPLSPRFGFAVNAMRSEAEFGAYYTTPVWVPTASATSANLPATSPLQPYLARYEFSDSPAVTQRNSIGLSADWRLSPYDVLSAGLQYGFYNLQLYGLPRDRVIINPGRVVAWGPDFTQGAAGAGSAQLTYTNRDSYGATYQPNLRWRHSGPIWKLEAGGAYSRSTSQERNVERGFWQTLNSYLRNVTVRFDHYGYLRPGGISVTDAVGQPVDTFKIADYRLEAVTAGPVDRVDIMRSFNAHARRDLALIVPVSVKLGLDFSSQTRDLLSGSTTYNYVGADGLPQRPDDSVAQWFSLAYLDRRPPWGLPKQEGFSSQAAYETYRAHPEYYQLTAVNEVLGYRNRVNGSKRMTESIYAPYLRFDVDSLLNHRLAISGGVRYEQTKFDGVGPWINPSAIYQRDTAGRIVRNAAGQPVVIAPVATLPGTQLAYVARGAHTERTYGSLYPSVNASWQFGAECIGRVSFAKSIARPDFSHILPSLNLPDETSSGRTVTLTNPNLVPWEANSYSAALEYYFSEKHAGLVSLRAYRRDIVNFWGATTTPITAEIIDTYGLNPDIYNAERGYVVSTRQNIGDAQVDGAEFEYRQNLAFLPAWARGFSVFANQTMQHLAGSVAADFTGFVRKTRNYGVTFNRAQVTARVSVNERGRERRAAFTGVGVEPGVYEYMAPRTTIDVSAEYRFHRWLALFGTARNLGNAPEDLERYGPSTPDYAKLRQRTDFRPLFNVGLKATF